MKKICLLLVCCLVLAVCSAAAEWYQKALDAGYPPDAEDQKHIDDVLGK